MEKFLLTIRVDFDESGPIEARLEAREILQKTGLNLEELPSNFKVKLQHLPQGKTPERVEL